MKWRVVKLDALYEVHNGLSKSRESFGSGFPFLSYSTVFNNFFLPNQLDSLVRTDDKEQASYSILKGDVFITRTSETSNELGMSCVALNDYPCATYNGFCKRLRPITEEVYPRYIGYYLRSPEFRSRFDGLGAAMITRASLKNEDLLAMTVRLPPLPIQQKIADILGAYDDLIENNRRRIELLEKMARELYRERFVRREPKSSPCKLGELIEVCYGKDHKKLLAGEVPVYGSGGIMRNVDRALYSGEAILIPRKGTLNNVMYVNGDFWTVDTMFYAKPKNWYVAPYVYQLLSSMNLMTFNSGTAVPSMTTEILNSMPVLLPEEEHLRAYAGMFGVMFSERILLESQNRNLVKQRDRLLPRLMSGKIDLDKLVKEAE